jgi:nucleotide-binding universal stress UspA family protein
VPVRVTALRGDAGPTLVEVARDADLLVVGAHGRTGHHWRRLGVVTAGAIVTAVPPVMVVRAAPQAAALDAPIVVGVDGSECSRRALRWALSEASRRGTRVLAVHGWEPPLSSLVDPVPVALHTVDARRRGAEELLDDELARVAAFAPRVPREPLAVRHPGGKAILGARAETGAGLVVVGRHAGPAGTVHALGSVSRHVLGWCPAPVVAVR